MNIQDEKLDEMMSAWERKSLKKEVRKYKIGRAIAFILIIIIWSYSIKIISETHIKIKNTEWYEVKAECIKSISYEVDTWEKVSGKKDYVRGKETRYSNVYEYTAKDGNVYTAVEKGETSAQEGSSTTYLVDEDNPEHAINALGEEEAYIVVVIIAGGMTFCILMVLALLKPRVLRKRKDSLANKGYVRR